MLPIDYPEGATVWQELRVASIEGIETFYSDVLGWSLDIQDRKGIFRFRGEDVVAGLSIEPDLDPADCGWVSFLGVGNLATAGKLAISLGCEVIEDSYTLAVPGSATILNDPFGARFGLAALPEGIAVVPSGKLGRLSLVDATNHDILSQITFQRQLFSDQYDEPVDAPIHIIRNKTGFALRACNQVPPELQEFLPPHWLPWFNVASQTEAVDSAITAGGRVNTRDNELSFGLWGVVADPQGFEFKTLQLNRAEI